MVMHRLEEIRVEHILAFRSEGGGVASREEDDGARRWLESRGGGGEGDGWCRLVGARVRTGGTLGGAGEAVTGEGERHVGDEGGRSELREVLDLSVLATVRRGGECGASIEEGVAARSSPDRGRRSRRKRRSE